MKFALAAATALVAFSSVSAQETTTVPPAFPKCTNAILNPWIIGTDARNCTQQAKYTPVAYQIPNATTFDLFCPNSFCRALVANFLNFRPAEGDCVVTRSNVTTQLFTQIVDPFAKTCTIEPAPPTSKPPATSAPPTTTAPPATTAPATTRPACA